MKYRSPLEDMRFALSALAGLPQILSLPEFDGITADVVDAVLDENGRFAEQALAPLNRKGDTHPAQWAAGEVRSSPGFAEAFGQFVQAGWQGLNHSRQLGGQGLPKMVAAAASENINAANLSFSLCPLLTDGVIEALATVGSPEQQALYIPAMLSGRFTGTMNLTEPQAGSDLAQVRTMAHPQEDGSWRLSGQKIFITWGEHDMAENIVHLVLARTPDAPEGVKGISLFIVPKFLVQADGSPGARNDVWCASLEHKLGIHGSPTAVLLYGSGKGEVGEGAVGFLVGERHQGLKYMFVMMNAARYAVGLQGVALSERARQAAEAYARERVQGQALQGSSEPVAIIRHPDVQRMLLTMRALTEGARALAYVAAGAHDLGHFHPDDGQRREHGALYEFMVPVVKAFCTETAVEVSSLAIQVHGGTGFIEESGVAQYYRDARILPIYEGTTGIQANDFLGRKLLHDGGAVAGALAAAMRSTLEALDAADAHPEDAAALTLVRQGLAQGVQAWEQAFTEVLGQARGGHWDSAFLSSVPALMLAGTVLAGWQMARAALHCSRERTRGRPLALHARKMASCAAYAAYIMPRAGAWAGSVAAGAVMAHHTGVLFD
ncbi:MAG: acyl-CoA dehydrogenase [Castellaniella sp.]